MKHTPGPWHACCLDGPAHYVFGPNGDETICGLNHNDPNEPTFDPHLGVITVDQRRANARLIAAAPELLAALESILAEADGGWFSESPVAKQARTAIKKARGQ